MHRALNKERAVNSGLGKGIGNVAVNTAGGQGHCPGPRYWRENYSAAFNSVFSQKRLYGERGPRTAAPEREDGAEKRPPATLGLEYVSRLCPPPTVPSTAHPRLF